MFGWKVGEYGTHTEDTEIDNIGKYGNMNKTHPALDLEMNVLRVLFICDEVIRIQMKFNK